MPVTESYGRQVTDRFLFAVDSILSDRSKGKITQQQLGEALSINSSNINRLKADKERNVTLEACCRLCNLYKVSAFWLLLGTGEMYSSDELTNANITLKRHITELNTSLGEIKKALSVIKRAK